MTDDRLTKVKAEIERLYNQSLADENRQAELGLKSAACTSYGKSKVCKELLSFIDSMQKEPKECMYSKDDYTDEDRKALCDGCKEECKFNKKEYSVNNGLDLGCGVIWRDDDLEKAAKENAKIERSDDIEVGYDINRFGGFVDGANWHKEQMLTKAVDATVNIDAGGYPYIPQMELYDYEKDIPLAKEGDKYKVILIKEE